MAAVPGEDLPWIEERLAAWDLLTEAERRDVLESERRLSWFVRQAEVSSDRQRVEAYMATLPPPAQQAAREQMERWLALPLAERTRKAAAFSRFRPHDCRASSRLGHPVPNRACANGTSLERLRRPDAGCSRAVCAWVPEIRGLEPRRAGAVLAEGGALEGHESQRSGRLASVGRKSPQSDPETTVPR